MHDDPSQRTFGVHEAALLLGRRQKKKPVMLSTTAQSAIRQSAAFSLQSSMLSYSISSLVLAPPGPWAQVDVFPVVEAGAAHLALVKREPERLDQVQRGAGGEAASAGVAGVPVDLGMHEHDVDGHEVSRLSHLPREASAAARTTFTTNATAKAGSDVIRGQRTSERTSN